MSHLNIQNTMVIKMNKIPKGRITITMNSGIEYKHDLFEEDCKSGIFNLKDQSDFIEKVFLEMETMTVKDKESTSIYRIKDISIIEIKQLF